MCESAVLLFKFNLNNFTIIFSFAHIEGVYKSLRLRSISCAEITLFEILKCTNMLVRIRDKG